MATKNVVSRFGLTLLLGVTLAAATGCASTGVTSISTRASRFGAYPIDDEIVQQETRTPQPSVRHVARGYGYVGG